MVSLFAMLTLYSYFRSSAAFRVRLGLAYKALPYRLVTVNLRAGEQLANDYLAVNPTGLVPALATDHAILTQSLAILEYLDDIAPSRPLLPPVASQRAKARALALTLAADGHPVNNLRVQLYLRREMGADDAAVKGWLTHWFTLSLNGFAALLPAQNSRYCLGDELGLPDLVLIPHLASARRFGVDPAGWPRLAAIESALLAEPWVQPALPRNQPDWVDVP